SAHAEMRKNDANVEESFDRFWRRCLHDGIVPGTAFTPRSVNLRDTWRQEVLARKPEALSEPAPTSGQNLEVIFRPDPTVHDGRFGSDTGFNAYRLRTSKAPAFDRGLTVTRTGRRYTLARTQAHHMLTSETAFQRGTVRVGTLAEFDENKHFALERHEHYNGP